MKHEYTDVMNKYQGIVLVVTALLIIVAWLFPPFMFSSGEFLHIIGHDFPLGLGQHIFVNYHILCFEWLGIILIGVLVYLSLHKLDK